MTVEEAARDGLRRRLDEMLGPEHATTLMTHLPPIDSLATRDDVRALGGRIDHLRESMDQRFAHQLESMDQRFAHQLESMDRRFEAVDRRFEAVDQRFEAVDQRFEAVDQRFHLLQEAMDLRFEQLLERMADRDRMVDQRFSEVGTEIRAAQAEILATVRGDMVTQTRAMFFTMAGSVAALGGLALGLARLV